MKQDFFNSETFYELIVENMSEGLLVVQNNKIIFGNGSLAKMLGYSAAGLQDLPVSRIFDELDPLITDKLLNPSSFQINTPVRFGTVLRCQGGEIIAAEITIQKPATKQDNRSVMIVKRSVFSGDSPQVREGEDRYRTLWELSPSGIIMEDAEGTIIDVNPAFCRYLGYSREELLGRPVHILAHPDRQAEVSKNIKELLSGKVLKHHAKSVARDGSLRFMELHETMMIMPDGKPGILSIAADVTEQLQAGEERLKREKMQSVLEIAGAVCHELNQPMTVISVNCDLILMNQFKLDEIFGKIELIKKQLNRMTDITKKLMHITKYETRDYLNGTRIVDIDRATNYHKPDSSDND